MLAKMQTGQTYPIRTIGILRARLAKFDDLWSRIKTSANVIIYDGAGYIVGRGCLERDDGVFKTIIWNEQGVAFNGTISGDSSGGISFTASSAN